MVSSFMTKVGVLPGSSYMFFFVRIMRAGRAGAEMLSPSCVGRGSAPHYPKGRIGAMKILPWGRTSLDLSGAICLNNPAHL